MTSKFGVIPKFVALMEKAALNAATVPCLWHAPGGRIALEGGLNRTSLRFSVATPPECFITFIKNNAMSVSIPDFSDSNLLVIGDLMMDRYWSGGAERISPEAPVPVVSIRDVEERPGGAGNVARSITALGGHCVLAALLGGDAVAEKLKQMLKKECVDLDCVIDSAAKTVLKLRVLSHHQQLIRLDFEDSFSKHCVDELTKKICGEIEKYDALVFSDYGKGALRDVAKIIARAHSLGVKTFIDPKGSDFTKYKHATVITPNLHEFMRVVGEVKNEREIEERGFRLLKELDLAALIITRSAKGVTLLEKSDKKINIPSRAREVFDVTGAGDTFISALAASNIAGASLREAVNIANVAASIVVGKLGAATVTKAEIENELIDQIETSGKILEKAALIEKIGRLKKEHKKIAMTNGCFDILHSGHVEYLSKARRLADVLVVAVNSDDSVKRLKGDSRPVNPAKDRMRVLSGLQSVDWLVEFDDDSPLQLISEVLPDTLVKGGDYEIESIVGADLVREQGGEVKTIEYVQSRSTSEMIRRIKMKSGE